jgi:hypothetical protein
MRPRKPEPPPQYWAPNLKPDWVELLRPMRIMKAGLEHRIAEVTINGLENFHAAKANDAGVLVTPNHPASADPFVMYRAADHAGMPFYFMAAWQTFGDADEISQTILRWHGVFSVDREGADRKAFSEAVKILSAGENPLVIFPEGEVYHLNDRVTPFRDGAAAIALTAAKKANRTIRILPTAIRYRYLDDPTPKLCEVMSELEEYFGWVPKVKLQLTKRIYRFAEGLLALQEIEYLGGSQSGDLKPRIATLCDAILQKLEFIYATPKCEDIPERIKNLRREGIRRINDEASTVQQVEEAREHMTELLRATQMFSYPGDYLTESPTVERIAETIDKLAEDVLDKIRASICADRAASVTFGEPIEVPKEADRRAETPLLTMRLEKEVQRLIDLTATTD